MSTPEISTTAEPDPEPEKNARNGSAATNTSSDPTVIVALISVAVLAAVLAAGAAVAYDGRAALGVGVGGLIALANLAAFVYVVRGVFSTSPYRRLWVLLGVVKVIVLFGGVWLLWDRQLVSPLAMVVGYGALPLGLTVSGLAGGRGSAPSEDTKGVESTGVANKELIRAGSPSSDESTPE